MKVSMRNVDNFHRENHLDLSPLEIMGYIMAGWQRTLSFALSLSLNRIRRYKS